MTRGRGFSVSNSGRWGGATHLVTIVWLRRIVQVVPNCVVLFFSLSETACVYHGSMCAI